MTDEDVALADLLEFALAPRPERLTDLAFGQLAPEERAALAAATELVAKLGAVPPAAPPHPGVRDRILATLHRQRAASPRRALVVCDMIVDHLTPGRALEVPRARGIVDALAQRIRTARSAGLPVVYVVDRHAPDDPELESWGAHAIEGTDGAGVWPALAPDARDHVVTKSTYSAFHGTELEPILEQLGVETLVLTGCATEIQLWATATDALQRGFAVEVPADSQAGATEAGEKVALGVLAGLVPYAPARRRRLERLAQHA